MPHSVAPLDSLGLITHTHIHIETQVETSHRHMIESTDSRRYTDMDGLEHFLTLQIAVSEEKSGNVVSLNTAIL